jgi:hypothetical protein
MDIDNLDRDLFGIIICCLSEDQHLIRDAVLLKCGGNACAKCSTLSLVTCNHCKSKHNGESDLVIHNMKTAIDLLIQSNYSKIMKSFAKQYNGQQCGNCF